MCAKTYRGVAWAILAFGMPLVIVNAAAGQQAQNLRVAFSAWATPPVANITPESKPIYDAALADLRAVQDGLTTILKAQSANKMAALAPTVFTKLNSALAGLNWRSRFLTELGEPCGVELSRRRAALSKEYTALENIYRTGQKAQAFNANAQKKYGANIKMRQAAYKKASDLAMKGKAAECEQFVFQTTQKWILEIGLLHNDGGYLKDFAPAMSIASPAMATQRRNEGAAALMKLRQSVLPNVDQTLAATQKIVDDIKQTGTATVGTTEVDGPQAFDQVARFWKITHWNLHKAEAVEMARCGLAERELPDLVKIRAEHKKLTSGMATALASIIAGDTARADQETLDRYLKSAAALRANALPRTLGEVDKALGAMAVKLHGEAVGELNTALNDLLRWRAMSADARATALGSNNFVDAQRSILVAAQSAQALNGIIARTADEDSPRFIGSAPEIVTLGNAAGKKVTLHFVAPSTPTATVRISRLHNRVFATLPPTWDTAQSVAQLKSDLLITDELPALTLGAASSVQSAAAGSFRRVGGIVKGAYPKSLIVEKYALPAVSWNMLPLGPMPYDGIKDFLAQALIHVDVTPAWFQHEHFLAPAKQAGATAGGGG